MEFDKYLAQTAKKLDREVEKILRQLLIKIKKIDPKLVSLAQDFAKACHGGKNIRGTLVSLGFELSGGDRNQEILKVGAAYEIIQTSLLIHDDIIDKSPIRRSKKSLYKEVGQDQAIILGDLGFFLATQIISETSFEDKEKNQALELLSKTLVETSIGQMLDMKKGDPKTLMKFKTAYYTIAAPLQLGAILAGADARLLGLLGRLGEDLGVAYQIRDDSLDREKVDSSSNLGVEYVAKAKQLIPSITSNQEIKKLLEQMADYILERKK